MKRVILFLLLLILPLSFTAPVEAQEIFKVIKVIDGDTIVTDIRGHKETVRLLGVDTPESVDPRKPVQCFAKEATNKLKSFVDGKSVILVDDRTQGNRDKYKRLLRYVYLPDSKRTFVNGEMIKQGYAFSFREYPTKMLDKFNSFEKNAREHSLGLWGSCPVSPTKAVLKAKTKNIVPTKSYVAPTSAYVPQANTNTSPSTRTYSNSGDKDCKDFGTHAEAQAYFNGKGGSPSNNVDNLDADHDGLAYESLQ